ncbi:DNase I-like protein [Athelia psychrophila]|uniref:DNase I-like protein n=1 Tax=Athelia psychrophila TaxID=1759441 RepID=A0A166G0U7_9AGAM|nr:DNase I-like protein [Fibularhizoctonia sp. CBS 109695]
MAEKLQNDVKSLLRPSEELTVALQALQSPDDAQGGFEQDRVLALVKHRNKALGIDEGSVFVLKYKLDDTLQVSRVYPIIRSFALSTAQSPRSFGQSVNMVPAPGQAPAPADFTLTIQPASYDDAARPKSIILSTRDITRLRVFLAESKRFKEQASLPDTFDESTFPWISHYTVKRIPEHLLCTTSPSDLRTLVQPLHTRLSTPPAGETVNDYANIEIVRDDWIRGRAAAEQEIKGRIDVRIRVGTFNVNGKMPSQDLAAWVSGLQPSRNPERADRPSLLRRSEGDELIRPGDMGLLPPLRRLSSFSIDDTINLNANQSSSTIEPESDQSLERNPDIIVLGFQEVDLSTEALLYSTSTAREDAWCASVFAGLGAARGDYVKLASKQLVGMLMMMIVKTSILPYVGEIKLTAAGAGIMGMMGNKGGTALRFTITPPLSASTDTYTNSNPGTVSRAKSTTLTFVNAHLAAFDEMVDKRDADYHDIGRRLRFDSGPRDSNPNADTTGIWESDIVVWMVNLNYRIDLNDQEVRALLKAGELDVLQKFDQLKNSQRGKTAFEGLVELPLTHLPSYRYGSGAADELGYDIKRKPAWTDRILHMQHLNTRLEQLSYTCHPEIAMSDHRPVAANFRLEMDVLDANAYNDTVDKLYRSVSSMEESDEASHLHLDSSEIHFGKIFYQQPATRIVTLENRSKVPCVFHFIPLNSDGPLHPEWLRISPMAGLMLPNESAALEVTICVDSGVACGLNTVSQDLHATLVLHSAMGSDAFLLVTGEYQYTCFATPLSRLVRTSGPIRTQTLGNILASGSTVNAPREIMRLINWMMTYATQVHGLFIKPAEATDIFQIRECLDTGADFPQYDDRVALAMAQTLLHLFDSLPESLIPTALHAQCAHARNRDEAFELLGELPNEVVNVWISVTAFLHYVAQQQCPGEAEIGTKKTEELAVLFAPVFFRDATWSYPPISPVKKREFVLYFIG